MPADLTSLPLTCAAASARESGTVRVGFVVPAGFARHAQLLAEFAAWAPIAMDRRDDGTHHVEVWLRPGRTWRYQFLLDDRVVVNDPAASTFGSHVNGGHISVIRT